MTSGLRIALFTPFSPEIGGGSAQLRSHLAQLTELDVSWHYLAAKEAANSQWKWMGERFSATELLSDFCARSGFLPGSTAGARLLAAKMDADVYWVVAHYEGIAVASELLKRQKRVHLTVHDDPFATWERSRKFSLFRPLLSRVYPRLVSSVASVDVTSWGMRNEYRERYGAKCFSVYRHVERLPRLSAQRDRSRLTIGHIGTLYDVRTFERFLAACRMAAASEGRDLRILRIGASPELDAIAAENSANFESHPDLPEAQAIPLLASCDFLYAMYPDGRKFEHFRRTSLPVKLSTYLQAQRPIFAHSPADSTLACVVEKHQLGVASAQTGAVALAAAIGLLLQRDIKAESFEAASADLMGKDQVLQLRAALLGEDWTKFSESDCHL
jgi:hypothetical protein